MKKTVLSLFFVGAGLLSSSTAKAITCYAQSPVAWGVGYSFDYYYAQNLAMYECQIRTPYGLYCVITGCNYYDNGPTYLVNGGIFSEENSCPQTNDPESPEFDPACPPSFEEN
jgi:hypothetical protein